MKSLSKKKFRIVAADMAFPIIEFGRFSRTIFCDSWKPENTIILVIPAGISKGPQFHGDVSQFKSECDSIMNSWPDILAASESLSNMDFSYEAAVAKTICNMLTKMYSYASTYNRDTLLKKRKVTQEEFRKKESEFRNTDCLCHILGYLQ
jgi:hypothetical protein